MSKPKTVEPPVDTPTPADPDAPMDIKDFNPESRGLELDDIVSGKEPEAPIQKEPEAPDDEPVIPTDPPKAVDPSEDDEIIEDSDHSLPDEGVDIFAPIEMDDKPKELDPADEKKKKNLNLRESLTLANDRVKAFETENDQLKKQVEELQEAQEAARRADTQVDPVTHPDVRAIIEPWNDEMESMAKQMTLTGSDGAKLKQHAQTLVERYRDLGDQNSEGFEERRDVLINTIEENFPEDRKEVVGIIAKGPDTLNKVQHKIAEIQENGEVVRSEVETEQYNKVKQDYASFEETFFNPSDDLKENNPDAPKVVLARHIESSPEVAQRADAVKTFLRKAILPLPPIKASDVKGMSSDEKAAYAQNRLKNDQAIKSQFHAMVGDAFLALGMISGMDKLAVKMRAENEDYRRATPRLGDGDEEELLGVGSGGDDEPIDIKDFDPGKPNLNF